MKNIFKLYENLDQWMIARINDAYLWLYDWTGIFVGTVLFLDMMIVVMDCVHRDYMWIGAIIFVLSVLGAGYLYYMQGHSIEIYNKTVLAGETPAAFNMRTFFIWWNIGMIPFDAIRTNGAALAVAADLAFILMWYLYRIKIRDRQKKDFKIMRLAHDTHS